MRQALEDFDRAIVCDVADHAAYYTRGATYFRLELHNRAIADFSAALRLKPDFVEALNDRGGAWGALGEYRLALSDFDAVLALRPNDQRAAANRALAMERLGATLLPPAPPEPAAPQVIEAEAVLVEAEPASRSAPAIETVTPAAPLPLAIRPDDVAAQPWRVAAGRWFGGLAGVSVVASVAMTWDFFAHLGSALADDEPVITGFPNYVGAPPENGYLGLWSEDAGEKTLD